MAPKFSRGQAKSQEHQVGEFLFRFGILQPMEALALEHEIKGALAPAISAALGGGSAVSISSLMGMSGDALGGMLQSLASGVSEALTKRLFHAICGVSQVQDDEGQFYDLSNKVVADQVFMGSPLLVYKFIWQGMKVNWADFLAGFQSTDLQSLIAAAQVASPSESPST